MQYYDEDKETLYSELRAAIDAVPNADKLIILGGFNARVGSDSSAWEGVLGRHGVGQNALLLAVISMSVCHNIRKQPKCGFGDHNADDTFSQSIIWYRPVQRYLLLNLKLRF